MYEYTEISHNNRKDIVWRTQLEMLIILAYPNPLSLNKFIAVTCIQKLKEKNYEIWVRIYTKSTWTLYLKGLVYDSTTRESTFDSNGRARSYSMGRTFDFYFFNMVRWKASHIKRPFLIKYLELHPYLSQKEPRKFCEKHQIQIEAWSPLIIRLWSY